MSLAAVSFTFMGKVIKDIEFFLQDSLHKHFSICKPPFLSQNSPIVAKFISKVETL